MFEFSYFIKIFIALLALVNPFEAIPTFLSSTKNLTREQKIQITRKTFGAVFVILVFSEFFGKYILEIFGISIASFSFAGGIIIFIIAIQMVIGKSDSGEKSTPNDPGNTDYTNIAVVPLATPLLAGPGAMSSIIVYGSRSTGLAYDISLTVIILLISLVVFLTLNATSRMEKILTPGRVNIITKISGLFVAAIAVEMIFSAIMSLIKLHST